MEPLILILLGTGLALAGLVAVGPQVRDHRIDPVSKAAWLLKGGAGLLILGQLLGLIRAVEPVLATVSLMMGGATLFAALTIGSHERQQPGFVWKNSLTLQIFGLGIAIVLLFFGLR